MTYYIADTHFNDTNIWRYERSEEFINVNEMNIAMIRNWNSIISEEDTVFILGDFGDSAFIEKLNGIKYLIKGNHDVMDNQYYRNRGFSEVYDHNIIKNFAILSHEPLYVNEHMPYINIYGHVHGNPNYKTVSSHGYCVSAERIGYKPISETEIIDAIAREKSKNDVES